MSKHPNPHDIFQKIGSFFPLSFGEKEDFDDDRPDIYSDELIKLSYKIAQHPDLSNYSLEHEDILIIASAWFEHIVERKLKFDPIKLLNSVFLGRNSCIDQLDRIITLLRKNIFYTQKKQVINFKKQESSTHIKYFKYLLFGI